MKAFSLFSENCIESERDYPSLSEFKSLKFLSAAKTSLKAQFQKTIRGDLNEI